ncbi:hypothetical protein OU798_19370 [Prolixibacteraceae bacterium Z1-6]|uniref:Uncharacterized protein n=1 Tax=Draconibacterium aestuarii TaxID=2998507 RepID=A0A9X3J6D3_9BACT|nr:hypothetical protein [Prolixibacteraceae bacterium Z1-6]
MTKENTTYSGLTKERSDTPNQSVAIFLQEAENLYLWSLNDVELLSSVGIKKDIINELPQRIEACRMAQTSWNNYRHLEGEAQKQWKLLAPQAMKLKKELLQAMRFAFRNNKHLLDSISGKSKDSGLEHFFQELNDIAVLGHANKELLININFDLSQLDAAASKSKELSGLWAETHTSDKEKNEARKQRNTTFWHLHELVTEIRNAGKYVFRNDKSRYIGYISPFWKNKYNKRTKPNKPQTPEY